MAGVLGLQNLAGFGFLVASVIVCNLVLIFVMAHGQPGTYFDLRPAPVFASELECLIPDKAAQLRQPMSTSATLLRLARFVVWQGLPENVLGFILWWTFWFGIVHGTQTAHTSVRLMGIKRLWRRAGLASIVHKPLE